MAKKPKITAEDAELLGEPLEENPAPPVEPAALEAVDPVLDAHLRRQENWEKDAKEIFRGPTEDEQRRANLLNDLSAHDAEWAKERKLDAESRAVAEKAQRAAELEAAIALNQSAISKAQAELAELTEG